MTPLGVSLFESLRPESRPSGRETDMTRDEFDRWIETHYTDLLKVAYRRGGDADAVQSAVESFLANRDLRSIGHPWTYLVNALRRVIGHAQRARDRRRRLHGAVKVISRAGDSHGWKRPAPRAD